MTIQPISAASAALYFTSADLQEHGFHPDELTDEQILQLTRRALSQAELLLDKPLEIESFPDKCGLLIFVRATAPVETVWCFEDFESLLAAAHTLGNRDANGSLYHWDDRYWLVLARSDPQVNAHLSEFSHTATQDPYIHARLTEYGTLILSGQALSTLQTYF